MLQMRSWKVYTIQNIFFFTLKNLKITFAIIIKAILIFKFYFSNRYEKYTWKTKQRLIAC